MAHKIRGGGLGFCKGSGLCRLRLSIGFRELTD